MVHVRIGSDELILSWDEWESRVESGRIPPDALVRFDAVTGAAWTPASDLEMYRSLADSRASAFARWRAASGPPVLTALLVGVQIRIWWLNQLPEVGVWSATQLSKWTAPTLEQGQVWRLVTMGVLHTSFTHILMNMLWLGYTGYHLERALGWRNLGWLYLASVVGGSTLSMIGAPDNLSLGASGGVYGLIAASVVFGFTRPELLPTRSRRVFGFALLPYLVLMFLSGMSNEGTDNWAHLGGLLTGGLLALLTDPPGFERRPGWTTRWHAATGTAIVVLLAVLWVAGPWIEPLHTEEEARWIRLARTDPAAARRLRHDDDATLHVSVPAGWAEGSGGLGRAWHTPLGARSWAAVEGVEGAPTTPEAMAHAYVARLDRMGWRYDLGAPEPDVVSGVAGLRLAGTLYEGDTPLAFVWRGAARGLRTLQTEWRVEPDLAGRLAPLERRLERAVVWEPPSELAAARAAYAAHPDTPRTARDLARALAAEGLGADALALQIPLARATPPDPTAWRTLLQMLAWYPQATPERDALLREALAAGLGSLAEVGVSDVLLAVGDTPTAVGLLELAWVRAPGDRQLARARAGLGLSNDLGTDGISPASLRGDCPWHAVLAAQAAAGDAADLLSRAAAVGAAWAEARAGAIADARARAAATDPGVVAPLVLLAVGHAPADPDIALQDLRYDLDQVDQGVDPTWWSPDLPAPAQVRAALDAAPAEVVRDLVPRPQESP